jgi:chemotaxis protein methyltransferase CheR
MKNPEDFNTIKRFIFSETGLTYYRDKEDDLRRKIDKAVKRSKAADYRQYLAMISSSPHDRFGEFDTLVSELTVGETHFFRDTELFRGIKEVVLPDVIQKNQQKRRLWIWSAGCATGEEVYSLSILINRHFPKLLQDWDLRIVGTDINRTFLHSAMVGDYSDWSFRGTPEEIRATCFDPSGRNRRIKPQYRKKVSFQYHNLVSMPCPSVFHTLFSFDIIFCRNVMIYFDAPTIRKLIRQFQEALVPDGWLVVGHADHNIQHFGSFKTVMLQNTSFYQNSIDKENTTPDKKNSSWTMPVSNKAGNLKADQPTDVNIIKSPGFTINNPMVDDQTSQQKPAPATQPESKPDKHPGKEVPSAETLAALINRGEWDTASTLCDALIKTNQMDTTLFLLSAFILAQKGLVRDAVASLKKALYLDRKFVLGHYHLGLLHQSLGELKKAEKSFINVVNLLKEMDDNLIFEMADGISAGQLKSLSQFHLEVLNG